MSLCNEQMLSLSLYFPIGVELSGSVTAFPIGTLGQVDQITICSGLGHLMPP